MQRRLAERVCTAPPTSATRPVLSNSRKESWAPTTNIRKTMPISAMDSITSRSPMMPGVNGPMANPASR
jgi:hypothetical protein